KFMAIQLWMVFEAIAPEKEALEDSLDDHIEMLETEDDIDIVESEIDDVSEVKDPHPGLEKGYSQVAELRLEVDGFDRAIETVVNYGPTYVQIEGPEKYEMSMREMQDSLQNVANTMHQYAQMGPGGVLISKSGE
ncbi:MAG: hypothetical protein ABEJ64_03380, partial [Candidatus Nanohaloarchaea archaeon]